MEFIIFKVPKKKSTDQDDFNGEFILIFKELTPILHNLFHKIETLLYSFYKAHITLIPKPEKGSIKKRELQVNIHHEYRSQNPSQNISR